MPNIKYKYSGPFLMRKFCDMHRIPNVFKTQFFLNLRLWNISLITLNLICELLYFMLITYLIFYRETFHPLIQNWDFSSKFFPIYKEILGFLNVALAGLLNFCQFMKLMENWFFEYKPKLHPKIFPNSLES